MAKLKIVLDKLRKNKWEILDWTMFFICLFSSYYFFIGTWEDFVARKSSFTIEEQQIKGQPTVSITFSNQDGSIWDRSMFELGSGVNITYHIMDSKRWNHLRWYCHWIVYKYLFKIAFLQLYHWRKRTTQSLNYKVKWFHCVSSSQHTRSHLHILNTNTRTPKSESFKSFLALKLRRKSCLPRWHFTFLQKKIPMEWRVKNTMMVRCL